MAVLNSSAMANKRSATWPPTNLAGLQNMLQKMATARLCRLHHIRSPRPYASAFQGGRKGAEIPRLSVVASLG